VILDAAIVDAILGSMMLQVDQNRESPMPYRFVHTADIHLDSPLKSLALRNSDLAELIGNATRRSFVRIIDLCLEQQVQALLIAGDLYDGDQTSMKTARFFSEQMRRLSEVGISVFIVRGNHDALSKITKELTPQESVKVFDGRAECIELDGQVPIAVHGLSFAKPHAPDSLLGKYKPAVPGAYNIGIMHTSLSGAVGHDLYAPCSVSDLQSTGFNYWALGHIHKRSAIEGKTSIVMPGNPQGRDIKEDGVKSVTLVTVRDDRTAIIEEQPIAIAQFERITLDASSVESWTDLIDKTASLLEEKRSLIPAEHLVARINLTGSTPLAWRVWRDLDLLKTELETNGPDRCWIEKIEVSCSPRSEQIAGTAADQADPLLELRDLIQSEVLNSEGFRTKLTNLADELKGHLPHDCRDSLGTDEASAQSILSQLARNGAEEVLAYLQATERGE
jgi:DNA repair exonuclease SbcCD nuclease subunit